MGAPNDDDSTGAVYVFERSGETWSNTAKLTASDGAGDDELGYSVAIDGSTIVAGARRDDEGVEVDQGSVYTFARTGPAARNETAKLTASDGLGVDFLGNSVAIDGDTVLAGAAGDDLGFANQGSLYTFASTGAAARTETAKLSATDGATNDFLGTTVDIDGNTIVTGVPIDDDGGSMDEGSVYTFARTGLAARTETAKLTASDAAAADSLGGSVAVDGDTIVAGASGNDAGSLNSNRGAVYTFASTGAPARNETGKLAASDAAADDYLGVSVAIDGETIIAGALFDDVAQTDQGSAYTFTRSGPATRTETGKLSASDGATNDGFGTDVATSGGTSVVSAPFEQIEANAGQGSAWAYYSPRPAATDTIPPETSAIKGKKRIKRGKRAKFRFSSSEAGSTFLCRLDKKRFKPCKSPQRVRTKKLKLKKHVFRAYAVDPAGNADPTPAKLRFKVVR